MVSQIIKKLHLLSFDVVLGAIVGNMMFWKLPDGNGKIDTMTPIVLGSCTWIIYILDRILDNLKPLSKQTVRHLFHEKYKNQLQVFVLLLFIISVTLLFYLSTKTIQFGLFLFIPLIIYFFAFFKFKINYIKEPFTAFFYTAAVSGTALVNQSNQNLINHVLALGLFCVAFQNLLIFSLFEIYDDKARDNLVSKIGKKPTIIAIVLLFLLIINSFALSYSSTTHYQVKCQICIVLMSTVLLLITFFPRYFLKNDRYRWVGDAVFFIPIFILK